jgi:general L-amino acid transport system permease protein
MSFVTTPVPDVSIPPSPAMGAAVERPRLRTPGSLAKMFGTPLNAVLTILFLAAIASIVPGMLRWLVLDAAFLPAQPETCKAAQGACWSFVIAKSSQILFGIYPPNERWRPALVCLLILAVLGWSVRPTSWTKKMAFIWLGAMVAIIWLMRGGFGLAYVPTSSWGGLPVTLILTVIAIAIAFPAAILLALGRRSDMPVVSVMCVLLIETIRGLPLLSILFVASIMLPLFVPEALLPDKFVRALVALTLFASAYLAEVIRGGLQAIPNGQYDGAKSLGLGYWTMQRLIVLPQAIKIVIPALANTIIVMIKNTSLVMVVGLFDLISSGKAALADPLWPSPSLETYLFIAAIYFALAFAFGRFADFMERRGTTAH